MWDSLVWCVFVTDSIRILCMLVGFLQNAAAFALNSSSYYENSSFILFVFLLFDSLLCSFFVVTNTLSFIASSLFTQTHLDSLIISQPIPPSLLLLFLFLPSHRHHAPREPQYHLSITPPSRVHPASAQQQHTSRRPQLRSEASQQHGSHESAERFDDVVIRERSIERARRSDGREEMNEGRGENLLADGVERNAKKQILRTR